MNSSIYFLTDCHFKENTLPDDDKINSISTILKNDSNEFIYLAISGDISFSGQTVQFQAFAAFFELLKEKSGRSLQLICCPGNHDIFYSEEESYQLSSLISDCETLAKLKRENKERFKEMIMSRRPRMASYYSFQDITKTKETDDPFLSNALFDCDDKEINFYSLNNVLYSCFGKVNASADTKGHALLFDDTISTLKRNKPNQLTILLMHFPMEYYPDDVQSKLRKKISHHIDIVLNGHRHVNEKSDILGDDKTLILQGKVFQDSYNPDSSGFIKLDFKENELIDYVWEESYFVEEHRRKLIFSSSKRNKFDFKFSSQFYDEVYRAKIYDTEFNLDEIFVFPYLEGERYGEEGKREITIRTLEKFINRAKSSRLVCIRGNEKSGKTALSNFLTLKFFDNNYVPILCSGNEINNNLNVESLIKRKISEMYCDERQSYEKFKQEIGQKEKILIIDDFNFAFLNKLAELAKYFGSIVFITNREDDKYVSTQKYVGDDLIDEFFIQPLVKSKRKELSNRIYDALVTKGDKPSLSKEQFFEQTERHLSGLVDNQTWDPLSYGFLEIALFHSSESFDNNFYSSVYQARSLLILNKCLRDENIKVNPDIINRIVSILAYSLFVKTKQYFSSEDIRSAIETHDSSYGRASINVKTLYVVLLKAGILKESTNGDFYFSNRDIFSFYVAYNLNEQLSDEDTQGFKNLIQSDIFVPMNFNVLMCLVSLYKNKKIPTELINNIFELAEKEEILDDKNFSTAGLTKKDKETLMALTKEDIERIKKEQDGMEIVKYKAENKHKNDLFYVKEVEESIKKISIWFDRLKVCCILLKNFSSHLKIESKQKIVKLVLNIPGIVLFKFNEHLFKNLDKLFAAISESASIKSNATIISNLSNFIVSTKRAFILGTYDYGSRCFVDDACIDLLKENMSIYRTCQGDLCKLQKLMFSSFLTGSDAFVKPCLDILNSKNEEETSFLKTSAKLIGRRFVIENYELCQEKHKKLMQEIFKNTAQALEEKNRHDIQRL